MICSAKKIGYNRNKYLTYNNVWKYSIDFYFEIEYMHTTDLFLILYSYLRNNDLYPLDVYTLAISNNNKPKFFSRKTGHELSKMSYREFENWWEHRQWYDSSLLESKEIYGFRIIFIPELVDSFIKLNDISLEEFYYSYKPEYPWSSEILSIFDYFIDITNEDSFWIMSPKYKHIKKPHKH